MEAIPLKCRNAKPAVWCNMADDMTWDQRRRTMSKIRSKWTCQEKAVHSALSELVVEHEMHPQVEGSPDLIIPNQRTAVFLHGCFWHKCSVCFKAPKSNQEYWTPKLERNVQRDVENQKKLLDSGWLVVVIWEHEVKSSKHTGIRSLLRQKGMVA